MARSPRPATGLSARVSRSLPGSWSCSSALNQALFWSPDGPQCIYASAFALATLAYYAILVGLRPHHLVIWGAVFVAGLLPIWGGLGVDRDALAMIPLGIAAMLSGLLDQRVLARSLAVPTGDRLEGTGVGG